MKELLGRELKLFIFTDSKQLFDILITQRRTHESRLMLDSYAARQLIAGRELDNVGLIRSEFNLADDLSKVKDNGYLLDTMIVGVLHHPIEDFFCFAMLKLGVYVFVLGK